VYVEADVLGSRTMSCVTPHLYNTVHAMYQYHHQQQQLAAPPPHPHLLARPLLLCHRLPAVPARTPGAGDPYRRLAEAQPPRNPAKPLTSFSIVDILRGGGGREGGARSASPPPVQVSTLV